MPTTPRATPASIAPTTRPQQAGEDLWRSVSDFTLTALHADAAEHFTHWALGRVSENTWTLIASSDTQTPLGTATAWQASVCGTVQSAPAAALVSDLRRRRHPVMRTAAQNWGLRAYVGAPLCGPDGTRLGSLCGWSTRPVADDERLRARVSEHARFLGQTLSRELSHLQEHRQQDWASAAAATAVKRRGVRGDRDRLTHLVGAGTWQELLVREDLRGHPVADPAAVMVLDFGADPGITSTVALRRVARTITGVVGEVVGDAAVISRTGPRQFAVLSAAYSYGSGGGGAPRPLSDLRTDERTTTVAHQLREQLGAALPRVRTGMAVRSGSTAMTQVWANAQSALLEPSRSSSPMMPL